MSRKLFSLWLPAILWCLLIFFLSSKPTIKTSEVFIWDFLTKKSGHLMEYFILYLLLYRAVNNSRKTFNYLNFFYPLVFLLVYAISDELHQSFTPGREARTRDVFIDGFGGLIAIWFIKNILPKAPKKLLNWVKG